MNFLVYILFYVDIVVSLNSITNLSNSNNCDYDKEIGQLQLYGRESLSLSNVVLFLVILFTLNRYSNRCRWKLVAKKNKNTNSKYVLKAVEFNASENSGRLRIQYSPATMHMFRNFRSNTTYLLCI